MARFEKLRWVPMLIRAYHDAQMRVGPAESVEPVIQTVALGNNQAVSVPARKSHQATAVTVQKSGNKGAATRNRARKKNLSVPVSDRQNDATSRILRELRTTNRRLKGLDELRQQLKRVGMSLDEIDRRMSEWSTTAPPDRGDSGDGVQHRPMPTEPGRRNLNQAPWWGYPQPSTDRPVDNSNPEIH